VKPASDATVEETAANSKPCTPSAKIFERGRSYGTLPAHGSNRTGNAGNKSGSLFQHCDSTERENCSDTEAPPAGHEVNIQSSSYFGWNLILISESLQFIYTNFISLFRILL